MGGGSGLLTSLRGIRGGGGGGPSSSAAKKKQKKSEDEAAARTNDEAAGSAIVQASSSASPSPRKKNKKTKNPSFRGLPHQGGGVAITCGSGRSLFRNRNDLGGLDDDDDALLTGVPRSLGETATSSSVTTASSTSQPHQGGGGTTTTTTTTTTGSSEETTTSSSSPHKMKKEEGEANSSSSPQASVASSSVRTPGSMGRTIRGKEVASKAALFEAKCRPQNNSPTRDNDDSASVASSTLLSPPSSKSRRITALQQNNNSFWTTVLKQTSSEEAEQDLVSLGSQDVKKKSQWLQSAFSPSGGGNMPGLDDEESSMTQDLTETMNEDVSVLSESLYTTNTNASASSPNYYNYWTATNTPPRHKSPEAAPTMTDQDQLWKDAYNLWFQHGLLPWKPSMDEEEEVGAVKTAAARTLPVTTSRTTATTTPMAQNDHDDHEEQFHDSFMMLDDANLMVCGGDAPSTPRTVQASRKLHRNKTTACPLLTVFGGGGDIGSGSGAAHSPPPPPPPEPTAMAGPVVTPEVNPKALTKSPTSTSSSPSRSQTTSTPSSPIKLLPSLTPSPSALYSNYVTAYTAYVQDRNNPAKAQSHQEARSLLELSRQRQPL